MARSEIPVVEIVREGIGRTHSITSNATDGHYFIGNLGKTFLEIDSTDAGTQTLLIQPSPFLPTDGLEVEPFEVQVLPGTTTKAGPWRQKTFNQDKGAGSVWVDPSVSSTLKLYAFELEPAS